MDNTLMKNLLAQMLAFLILIISVISCYDGKSEREFWESSGISDYRMHQTVLCFCVNEGPYTVFVKSDTIYSAVNSQNGEPVGPSNLNLFTVDELFDLVEDASMQKADVLKVEFDKFYHYPKRIEIDYSRQAADDEITIIIKDFGITSFEYQTNN